MTSARSGWSGGRVSAVFETPLSGLRPWPENPRTIRVERLEELKQALVADRAMLAARPLLTLPDGTVIAGNQRLRAALELGWTTIPVVTVDLDPNTARVWALRDNNGYADWDEPSLADLLAELRSDGIELALTGFESSEIDRILSAIPWPVDPDDAPPPAEGEPDSRFGSVYELGQHRLLCGDATDPAQLAALFVGQVADVVWTDPPYGVSYTGKTDRALRIANDNDRAGQLLRSALEAADRVVAPSAPFYIAAPAGPQGTALRLAIEQAGWRFHQSLVWAKNSPVLGHSDYLYQHEDVLYGWKPGPGRPGRGRHRGSRWRGDNTQSTVFFVNRPARSVEHPTMKPVELIKAHLRNSSRRGELVVDLFAGSGSTLIAAAELDRHCFAVEIDPRYADVIRRRWELYEHGRG